MSVQWIDEWQRPPDLAMRGRFSTPRLNIKPVSGGKYALALGPVGWQLDRGGEIVTRLAFPTDGASIPWIAQWKYQRFDARYLRSAVSHDRPYSMHGVDPAMKLTRHQADSLLYWGMVEECDEATAERFYFWVRSPVGGYIWERRANCPLVSRWWAACCAEDNEAALDRFIASFA